jgi:hypothetical protein
MIKSRRMRWAGHVARMGEQSNAYRILVGKPKGKRPLEGPRRKWMDNIKINLREIPKILFLNMPSYERELISLWPYKENNKLRD